MEIKISTILSIDYLGTEKQKSSLNSVLEFNSVDVDGFELQYYPDGKPISPILYSTNYNIEQKRIYDRAYRKWKKNLKKKKNISILDNEIFFKTYNRV